MRTFSFNSPMGTMSIETSDKGVHSLRWEGGGEREVSCPIARKAIDQLDEYFKGERTKFELPLQMDGTSFQQSVWTSLQSIPFGETWSYGQLANTIGKPKASRAVGGANGKNPIPIIVPCHRVIGSSGQMTGFSGGMDKKIFLLKLEGSLLS